MPPQVFPSLLFFLLLPTAIACGSDPSGDGGRDASVDASMAGDDGGSGSDGGAVSDGGGASDGGGVVSDGGGAGSDGGGAGSDGGGVISDDGGVVSDGGGAMLDAAIQLDANTSIISGGPCISGATGQTAYRVRWLGNGPGSTAYPGYEINGLPDTSRDKTASYGYQIGFSPSYVDTFLGAGGLQLNSSNFVDIELSTLGVSTIQSATLSIYGRSYNTTASGSFNWQTFSGTGSSPTNLVANSAPYQWYSADMSAALAAGDDGVLLRIKAGPSSSSLVVNRIELCIEAQ
ncbi:MAG: hypothetical protein JKY56_26925 [Kofleriaceae bacterium]|nr:hypothetical protein [Kofleriaceae bacterium]